MAAGNQLFENNEPYIKNNKGITTKLPVVLSGSAANMNIGGNLVVTGSITGGSIAEGALTITASSANALAVGSNGTTNPALQVDTSGGLTDATGVYINAATAGSGIAVSAISSGAAENMTIDALGTGTLSVQTVATGRFLIGAGTTITTSSTAALAVGRAGATNPVFAVNAATGSAVTGITVTGAASSGGLAIATTSTAGSENLTIAAKGSGGTITFNPAVTATAGGAAADGIQFGSLSVGVFTGTGTPTFSAMNGSLYVDSNATTTTTRLYVNKSGAGTAGTTWTNFTAAA